MKASTQDGVLKMTIPLPKEVAKQEKVTITPATGCTVSRRSERRGSTEAAPAFACCALGRVTRSTGNYRDGSALGTDGPPGPVRSHVAMRMPSRFRSLLDTAASMIDADVFAR